MRTFKHDHQVNATLKEALLLLVTASWCRGHPKMGPALTHVIVLQSRGGIEQTLSEGQR